MKQFRIIVKGEVQSELFKEYVKREAERLNLKGYARTLDDGDLKILAQGDEKDLLELADKCKTGPGGFRVDKVLAMRRPLTAKFSSFEIMHAKRARTKLF